jgi:hypothetical protein
MNEPWYKALMDKVTRSYSEKIIILDWDNLAQDENIAALLEADYAVHFYSSELELRTWLKNISSPKALIIKPPEAEYLPYDIESVCELIAWELKEIFLKLAVSVLKTYSAKDYQKIYDCYKLKETTFNELDEQQTQEFIVSCLGQSDSKDRKAAVLKSQALKAELQNLLNEANPAWGQIAENWGKLGYVKDLFDLEIELSEVEASITKLFNQFILGGNYQKLFYESYLKAPLTLDKVLHYLAQQGGEKKVLICFDGMGWQEWFGLKDYFIASGIANFKEGSIFALIPTLTSISRKALFCGDCEIEKYSSEEQGFQKLVQSNWKNARPENLKLFVNVAPQFNPSFFEYDYPALIINLIDDLAHSANLLKGSKKLLLQNLRATLPDTQLDQILRNFLAGGYRVYLTSDHGSIWCQGNSYKADKYLVEERAKRALIYPNKLLAKDFARHKEVIVYESPVILGEKVAILPGLRKMFAPENNVSITHGGIHLEEVIVPFIEVLP